MLRSTVDLVLEAFKDAAEAFDCIAQEVVPHGDSYLQTRLELRTLDLLLAVRSTFFCCAWLHLPDMYNVTFEIDDLLHIRQFH